MTIKKVEEKLHKSCCKETCFDTRQQFWSHNKPESEQCFVTALLLNDIFGGKVIKAKSSDSMNHYWNLIDEKEIDLTRS